MFGKNSVVSKRGHNTYFNKTVKWLSFEQFIQLSTAVYG